MDDQAKAEISAILKRALDYKNKILLNDRQPTNVDYASLAGYYDSCLESIYVILKSS